MDNPETLRRKVEALLPNWASWYPSVFDAAVDLGLLRARVCAPSQLLLTNRHSGVISAAERAHREKWGGEDAGTDRISNQQAKPRKRRRRRKAKVRDQ